MNNLILAREIENSVFELRGEKVVLDRDVARFYGVETRVVNQAVRNNIEKFPKSYMFETTNAELQILAAESYDNNLRMKFLELDKNERGQHSKFPPKVFTEKGLYMLATILKSKQALETNFAIIETFAKLREFGRVINKSTDGDISSDERKKLTERGTELISEVFDDALASSVEKETSFELNFAMVKVKHSIKTTEGKDPRKSSKKEKK